MRLAHRVPALKRQQEIIGRVVTPCGGKHPVVPCRIAKEQQILGRVIIGRRPVVEHFHISAVSRGIRRAARKLVVQLICRHYAHPHAVVKLMYGFQALGLRTHLLCRRNYYHHVGRAVRMQILIGDAVHILRHRHVVYRRIGHRPGLAGTQCHIVQTHDTAPCLRYCNLVGWFQVEHVKHHTAPIGQAIGVFGCPYGNRPGQAVVHMYGGGRRHIGRHHHPQLSDSRRSGCVKRIIIRRVYGKHP